MTMLDHFTLVNLVALLVGLGFLYNGYRIATRGREAIPLFLMSIVLGLGLVFVALFQDTFEFVATVLGLEQKGRAILIVSNLTLFVVVTMLFSRISTLYSRLSRVNEELSLLRQQVETMEDAASDDDDSDPMAGKGDPGDREDGE
ncbi:DUF2304 domain-containing protein [Haloparvum sp. AD34]